MAIYVPGTATSPGTVPTTSSLSVTDIITRIKRQFGDEASVQVGDADVIRWVNDATRDIAIKADLLQTRATSNVTATQQEYLLPPDILTLRSARFLGEKLRPYSAQEAEDVLERQTSVRGTPVAFWTWANRISLHPTPDRSIVGALTLYYTKQPRPVAQGGDIPEVPPQYHNRIVEYCLQMAYELDENWAAAQAKQTQFTQGVDEQRAREMWNTQDYYPVITSSPEEAWYAGY